MVLGNRKWKRTIVITCNNESMKSTISFYFMKYDSLSRCKPEIIVERGNAT